MGCQIEHKVGVQGHRGCRGLLPENALPAFQKAIELGVQTLEMDIAVSKDNKIVVSHEPFMSRFYCLEPDGSEIPLEKDMAYNLYQMNYDSIKAFDCGSKQNPGFKNQQLMATYKPLLDEVFKLSERLNPKIRYNIELKAKPSYDNIFTPEPNEFVALVLGVVKKNDVFGRCNLQSFDNRILEEVKRQAPRMPVAVLVDEDETIEGKLAELSFEPEIISPYYKLLNASNVKILQNEGFLVIPWTVNEVSDMKQMIKMEVNSIITDYPDRLIQLLEE